MVRTLGGYIADLRETLGLNQTELAVRAEVPRTTINRIESGTTQLPSPDVRRRIAKALGVSHLDILVAAGEISEDEVRLAGVPKIPQLDPRRQRIVDRFLALPIDEGYLTTIENVMITLGRFDPKTGQLIEDVPENSGHVFPAVLKDDPIVP